MTRLMTGTALGLLTMILAAAPVMAQTAAGSASSSTSTTGGSASTSTNAGVTYGSGWSSSPQGNVQSSGQMGAPLSILPGAAGTTGVVIGNRQAQTQPGTEPPPNPDENRAAAPSSGGSQASMSQGATVQGSANEGSSIQVGGGGVSGVGSGAVTGVGPGHADPERQRRLPEMQIQRRPGETTGTVQ